MSTPPKPQGGKKSTMPLALLKALTLDKREWAYALASEKHPGGEVYTNADCRGEIRERLGISLGSDSAYSDFRSWHFRQRQWDVLGDLNEQDEQTLKDRFPNLSADKIRDTVIKRQFAVAELMNDPTHTLKVIKASQNETALNLDSRKLKLLEQKAAQADQAKGILENPELSEADKKARMHELFGLR